MGWAGDTWSFVPPIIAFSCARVITLKDIFEGGYEKFSEANEHTQPDTFLLWKLYGEQLFRSLNELSEKISGALEWKNVDSKFVYNSESIKWFARIRSISRALQEMMKNHPLKQLMNLISQDTCNQENWTNLKLVDLFLELLRQQRILLTLLGHFVVNFPLGWFHDGGCTAYTHQRRH